MHALELFVVSLAHSLPLEAFVFIGSFLEEVIAPIPSPSIMVLAGSFAVTQGYQLAGVALLVLLASLGKTFGGLVMYFIADTIKDVAFDTFGKRVGITSAEVERFGARFNGTPRDYLIYIFFRSIPIIPSILLSFGSGAIRLPLRLFIIGTFVGTIIRDSFYITVGYIGTGALARMAAHSATLESHLTLILGGIIVGVLAFYLFKRKRASTK